ncbi:MAG: hypothetical protein COA47_14405 [Robiginitomaculum sp.]|nr:MAG: hypothetical protein COA47_14405 [Robiginitomaculum sp.]
MIFISQHSSLAETFHAFQQNGAEIVDGMIEAKLSDEFYLYIGGEKASSEHSLSAEFGFCQKIKIRNRLVGWNIIGLNQIGNIRIGRVYIDENGLHEDEVIWFYFPENYQKFCIDPLKTTKLESSHYSVWSNYLPKSQKLNLSDSDCETLLTTDDELLAFSLLNQIGIHTLKVACSEMFGVYKTLSPRNRLLAISKMFRDSAYNLVGWRDKFHCPTSNWPFPDPDIPDELRKWEINVDSKIDIKRAENFLLTLRLKSFLTSVNSDQVSFLEKNLIPLGRRIPARRSITTDNDVFIGQKNSGEQVVMSAALPFEEHTVWICSCNDGFRVGELITRHKAHYGKETAHIVGELWKNNNHSDYFTPERQKGIALALVYRLGDIRW